MGTYAINGSGLAANNGNYTFQQAAGNSNALTIDPALLTYTAAAVSRTYGSSNPIFAGSISGFVNGDSQASSTTGTLAFTSPATLSSNVGSYLVNGSGLTANHGNYTFQQAAGNAAALTIDPAVLTYTAGAVSRTYGDANPALTGAVTGFVNGDSLSSVTSGSIAFTTAATNTSHVGTYAINGSGLTANSGNYTFAQSAANASALAITPAELQASVLASDKVYDATTNARGQIGSLSGIVGADDVSVDSTATAFNFAVKDVGVGIPVSETGAVLRGVDAGNYRLTVRNGSANINPVPLTVSIQAATKEAGAANPSFLAKYSGETPAGIDIAALLASISFQTTANNASAAGAYQITGSSSYPNVNLTILPGTLTVTAGLPETPPIQTEPPPIDTPPLDLTQVTARALSAVPLPANAISTSIIAPNSLGTLQIGYSPSWTVSPLLGGGESGSISSSSFLTNKSSENTYQGGVRPW